MPRAKRENASAAAREEGRNVSTPTGDWQDCAQLRDERCPRAEIRVLEIEETSCRPLASSSCLEADSTELKELPNCERARPFQFPSLVADRIGESVRLQLMLLLQLRFHSPSLFSPKARARTFISHTFLVARRRFLRETC